MDETALYWKMVPSRTLATKAQAGGKKSKDRITIALTSNCTGTDRWEPWCIGKSKNPRSLKNINRKALRIQYRNNKTKWMTGIICEEYLRWLNNKCRLQGRKVLLLMDNFSGHELAVQLVNGLEGLSNVRIAWLPPNTTSHWQPMDQGIIASFKLQYRRKWVLFMLRAYEAGKDPNKTVSLLKAIQWVRVAWEDAVAEKTIQRCWMKSTLIRHIEVIEQNNNEVDQRIELQAQIDSLPIEDPLSLNEFLTPESETTIDENTDIFETVVAHYSIEKEGEESEESDGEEEPIVPITEALRCLEVIQSWKLQQEEVDTSIEHALDRLELEMVRSRVSRSKQTDIRGFFQRRD
ncbi:hypothetical protein ACMFMG_012221 [Clarireedia jacksonii]